ncbi:hypothetical protein APSETT444_008772 [Aspergillus pseudonomiae]
MLLSLVLGALLGVATAQFPPTPEGVTVVTSKLHENVSISFKEARKDPKNAPLAIWLNGGPGGSSFMGLLEELGPCSVASDSKTTILNPWSWNNEVNLLFLDQPMQVGFSYDVATNGTLVVDYNAVESTIVPGDFSTEIPESNFTHRVGTFASQEFSQTANSSALAAHALWHFAQTWFFEFPHYKPVDDRISLWTESYGGHYGPAIFGFFQEQNERITTGTAEKGAQYLHLDTLGIVNGLIDAVVQGESYITIGYNNTYGLEIFNQSLYDSLMHEWARPGGCRDRAIACQAALKDWDSTVEKGNISEICKDIDLDCEGGGTARYQELNSVLQALGVPVNFTEAAPVVHKQFEKTYDITRGGFLDSIAHLLDSGVKVHMMYGDRDYACNWVGGEKASLAVPYSRAAEFANTGYSPLVTSEGVKGMTRQLGNYSFTRVYQAGHEVPAYQPVAAYEIFMRATLDRDIPTGLRSVTEEFRTSGPKDTWHVKNIAPPMPEPRCYVLDPGTCLPEVWERVVAGNATVKDFFVVRDGGNHGMLGWPQDTGQVVLSGM